MQHGYGVERWVGSGSIFRGEFVDGLRNGYGIWVHNNKKYEGEWKNNMMDGKGMMEWGVTQQGIQKEKSVSALARPTTGGTDVLKKSKTMSLSKDKINESPLDVDQTE